MEKVCKATKIQVFILGVEILIAEKKLSFQMSPELVLLSFLTIVLVIMFIMLCFILYYTYMNYYNYNKDRDDRDDKVDDVQDALDEIIDDRDTIANNIRRVTGVIRGRRRSPPPKTSPNSDLKCG